MATSDMFLKATGERTGEIVGESTDKRFTSQMDIIDWGWGMTAPSAVGGTRTGRALMSDVKIVKRVDKASTALMSVMKNNEILSTAVLSVRKAGGVNAALPYYVMTMTQARITAYEVRSDFNAEGSPTLTEHLTLGFKSVTIDYTAQSDTGGSMGSSSFSAEAAPQQ